MHEDYELDDPGCKILAWSSHTAFLDGTGVSTWSGITDFRNKNRIFFAENGSVGGIQY